MVNDPVNFVDPLGLNPYIVTAPIIALITKYIYTLGDLNVKTKIGEDIAKACNQMMKQLDWTEKGVENSCSDGKEELLNEIRKTKAETELLCWQYTNKYGPNKWYK